MEQKTERVLYQYGDRELWHADADDGSWQLPLFVEWRHDKENDQHFAHVTPAGICLYTTQVLALNALLQFHDIQGQPNQWVVPRRICEAVLRKAPGITVMRYYKWPGETSPPIETKPPLRTKIHSKAGVNKPRVSSFVEWLAKDTKISASIINAVLSAVANGATTWLVEHRKPLDLGFCRIVAVPFRVNWKEIVAFKARAQNLKLRTLFHLPKDKLWDALEEAGLPEILTSPHNVGLRRGWKNEIDVERIDYTLEVIASNQFEAAASRIEGARIARGKSAYVAEFEDAVEAVYQTAVSALRSYFKKVSIPFAEVLGRGGSSGIGFMPLLNRKHTVRGTPLCDLPVHVINSGSRFSVFGRNSDQFLIQAPAPEVPALPDIPPTPVDLRERTVDAKLELLGDGGADGVPLLPSGEGRTEREPVLVESTTAGDGVGTEGDWPVI